MENKYPSINQFRHVVRNVKHHCSYSGKDDKGEPVYKAPSSYPTLTFEGTVKLHGTNASVMHKVGAVESQSFIPRSRENVLSVEKDNYGFAKFVENEHDSIGYLISLIRDNLDDYINDIVLYGEWCGSGVQKSVAISKLPKMFVIFGAKVSFGEESEWLDIRDSNQISELDWCNERGIYFIHQFETFKIDIDFNNPELSQNTLIEYTESVEACCPVGKHFGVEGTGEGVVWMPVDDEYYGSNFFFKVKGEKHSVTKVKKLAAVDVEKLNSINEFADSVVTENRVQQAIDTLQHESGVITEKHTGDVIRWVFNDVMKEESDTMEASGLEKKDIGKAISSRARKIFFDKLDEAA